MALSAAIATAAARNNKGYFTHYLPGTDTTADDEDSTAADDSAHKLRFPIYDKTGEPWIDYTLPHSMDLQDPSNVHRSFDYNSDSNRYEYSTKLGADFLRNPSFMTLDEYIKYKGKMDEDAYWQRRMDALMLFNKQPELPQMYKDGLFDRIFGSNTISVKPQGNVDVTFGGSWQNIKNPTLVQRAQKYGIFDFDMQMNINLLATVGDKLKLNIANNTKPNFDYQNMQKLDYSGKEDEMIKKIEAGNISFPLKSNLISGVQSLFGLKTQLQFGKLWVTGVLSQQKSQRKSLTLQGGTQAQQFSIKCDAYEENRDFLLAQYFHDNYNKALANFPVINSLITINKIEVWVTNRTGAVNGVRDVLAFQDLGEANPYKVNMNNSGGGVRDGVPDNTSNKLYPLLAGNPNGRLQRTATNAAVGIGLEQGQDFERTTARQLASSEYNFNPQLGYIMLHTQLNPDDVLGVAFRYTYKGKVYQVGEFAEDIPPDTTSPKVIFLKLLKGTSARPSLPTWKLMMKNVYALGGLGLTRENFTMNVMYQDPGGQEKRYMPEGTKEGVPFIELLNLDHLNAQNEAQPDGVFDFVDGITVNTQQGKIIFPVLEPFGNDLATAINASADRLIQRKYIFQALYDSTKTVAQQLQSLDRYLLKGTYKSATSSEIYLGGFNIPPGSVSVTAGGTKLVEGTDYTVEYGLGRLKIINAGILSSGVPINIQYEDNSSFGFQQQNFMAARFDYYLNRKLTIGATIMRLNERPFTQKVNFGEDPIKNTVLGIDGNYQSEVPALTRALDKLPIYSTTAPSYITASLEGAALLPGHPKQINALDPEGSVYIDDFEGTTSSYDLRFPAISWSMSSTPFGAVDKTNNTILPESALDDNLKSGMNRAKLAWYTIEPTLVDPGTGVPSYVKNDSLQHYIRMVQVQDVFPNRPTVSLQSSLSTFDLAYFPNERGPYNFDATNLDDSGHLTLPTTRWGGITRPLDNTDFEASNVQYIEFWMMDPFINNTTSRGGSLYINLGDVSEDVLKDSRLSFENGIPTPFDITKLDTTVWGYVPRFQQQITRAFDNDPNNRSQQDVGYDELDDSKENVQFANFLTQMRQRYGVAGAPYIAASRDPANDDYHYYRGSDYDAQNLTVINRYKNYNNPEGNSPITDPNASYATSETTIPESEDINRDNTLSEAENYYQYRLDLAPNMQIGTNNIVNIQVAKGVKLPNGQTQDEKWYQFKIPIKGYDHKVGGIADFRSIRFMRMFLSGWQDSTILRFASLELDRSQWRTYDYSLTTPGENVPQQNQGSTDFTVTSVSIEENGSRSPVPYVIPPGVNRQLTATTSTQTLALNEASISLRTCALQDGDARAVYKEVNVDMRQFDYLRMFMHAESEVGQPVVKDGDIDAFVRIGSDFTDNYYEYRMPLTMTPLYVSAMNVDAIWPGTNEMDVTLQNLVDAKKERDQKGWATTVPYYKTDAKGNTIVIMGNPNIGGVKDMMLGVLNPKKTNQTAADDGLPKCLEVWFDELRMAGTQDHAGYAAAGKVSAQLADLGTATGSASGHTQGYGSIDQKIAQRSQDDFYQYNVSSNLNMGKLMPRSWGVQLPLFVGYTQSVSTPKYNPYDEDVLLTDALNMQRTAAQRDSLKSAAQDFTSITSVNLTNVRINGSSGSTPGGLRAPWSIKNFDFSYSYNDQFKHNPNVALDNLNTQRGGIGYTYAIKTKPFEPFKHTFKSKTKWLSPIRDINLTPLPSNFSVRNDLLRTVEETKVRDVGDASNYTAPSTFYKLFNWTRTYNLRWELTKSISFDYSATNISRIDEPYGRVNTAQKQDSLLAAIATFGHNTSYVQAFHASYNVPFTKLPATDWISLRFNYAANYNWTAAAPVAYDLGNTIGNTATKTIVGDLNFSTLYNKWRWMRALNQPSASKAGKDKGDQQKGGNPGGPGGHQPIPKMGNNGKKLPGQSAGDVDDAGPTSDQSGGGGAGAPGAPAGGGNQGGGTQPGGNAGGGSQGGSQAGGNAGGGGAQGGGSNTPDPNNPASPGNNNNTGGNTGSASNPNTGNTGGAAPQGGGNAGGVKGGGGKGNTNGGQGNGAPGGNGNNNGNNAGAGGNNGGGNSGGVVPPGGGYGSSNGATNVFQGVNTANLTEQQMDSLLEVQHDLDKAKAKADKIKKRKARRAKRKARRAKLPELNTIEQVGGHVLTMLTHVTINYNVTGGTTLPGWMDSTRFMGVNTASLAPGYNFVYGYQPNYAWFAQQAAAGRLTHDSLFNAQLMQTYSQNLNATATLQPFKDFRVDLSLIKTFSKSHSELYKDTGTGIYEHFNPYENGSFNISYISLFSMFKNSGVNSGIYNTFLSDRTIISQRLGASNPYTNGLPDPSNPAYAKGYTQYSQDVLVPSFIAAYSGHDPHSQPLIDYTHNTIQDNPFKYFVPMPNWKVTYNGLSKLPLFDEIFSNLVLSHAYTGTMSMNGFNSSLLYTDLYGLGFPSFIDSNSHNYVPFYQVPNVTIAQQFNPLVGIDASFKNHLTAKFELRKSKTESLSLIDYQVSENLSTEYVIGLGFRKKGVKLPFKILGVQKLKNELIGKLDIGLRDDKNSNTFLADNISVVSRGQKVIRISPSIDYSVSQKLTLHFYFDRQQTIPYVSSSFPSSTTKAGLTLRFIFAQ